MINERDFLERTHLDRATLEVWIQEEWICPERRRSERAYTDTDLARASLILDLKHKMGVNDEGLDVILHLIDQMHGLRKALAEVMARLSEQGKASR